MGSPLVIAAAPPAVPRVVAANGLAQALLRMSLDELRGKGVGEVFHTDRTGWQQAMQSPAGGTVECAVDVEPVMATRLHRSALRLRVDCRPWRKHLMLTLSTPAAAPDGAEPEDDENGRHAAEVERGVALQQVTLERLSILLVEDDTFSARVITELCGQCEYDVAHATDGHRCLDLLETSWRCETPPARARARNSAAQFRRAIHSGPNRPQAAAARAVQPGAGRRDDAGAQRPRGARADPSAVRQRDRGDYDLEQRSAADGRGLHPPRRRLVPDQAAAQERLLEHLAVCDAVELPEAPPQARAVAGREARAQAAALAARGRAQAGAVGGEATRARGGVT